MPFRPREDVPDEVYDAHLGLSQWVSWPPRKGTWLVRLDWTRVDGRLECCGLEIRSFRETRENWPPELPMWDDNPEPLLARTLRALPLGQMLHDLHRDAWVRNEEFAASLGGDEEGDELSAAFRAMGERDHGRKARSTRARRGIAPLDEVAAVYNDARNRRESTRQAIAKRWNVTTSTADKWVMKVRRETNLIPPPTNVKKGKR